MARCTLVPEPVVPEIDLAGIGFGIGDQVGDGLGRKVLARDQDRQRIAKDRHWLERGRIVVQVLEQCGVDQHHIAGGRQERVAVGVGLRYRFGCDIVTAARAVLDHNGLVPELLHLPADAAR